MDTDYGVSPFTLLRGLGPIMFIGPMVVWLVVAGPLILYPIARWRAHREPVADRQLGIKVALNYFAVLALQLALIGATAVVFAVIAKASEDKGGLVRFGFGLIVPAAIVLVVHVPMLRRTNEAVFPGVRRLFLGYNLIATGLFGFTALIVACQALFAKGSSGDLGRFAAAAVVVYGGAWVVSGWHYARVALALDDAAPPSNVVPPSATAPARGAETAAPGGPALPRLGGGAFPPIDPNKNGS